MLVLDGVENPGNVQALIDAAGLIGGSCVRLGGVDVGPSVPELTLDGLAELSPLVVLENAAGADSLFGFRMPPGPRPALVVGNERRGISREVLERAHRVVQIPVASPRVNTLNVAAAAAVALHVATRGGGGKLRTRADPERHRPELLFVGPTDEVELGSALRSAAAFGWSRVRVEDRRGVWFGTDRPTQALGRGAARRGRNAIRVVPSQREDTLGFDEAVVVTTRHGTTPLHREDLARGPRQLVVLADEGGVDLLAEDLGRFASSVRVAGLGLAAAGVRFRLVASIALAETFRQVGLSAGGRHAGRGRGPLAYDLGLELSPDEQHGELVLVQGLPD